MDGLEWVFGALSVLATFISAYFAWRAVQAQREAASAAKQAAASAERIQRIQFRPAIVFEWDQEPELPGVNAAQVLRLNIRNVGHATAVLERIRLFEYGNLRLDYTETHGTGQRQLEDFDVEFFQTLAGARLAVYPASASMLELNDQQRAMEVGAVRALFAIKIPAAHADRVIGRFREGATARVSYRSLAGEEYDTEEQFADLRRPVAP